MSIDPAPIPPLLPSPDSPPEASPGSLPYTQWDATTGRIISVGWGAPGGAPPTRPETRKLWGVEHDPLTRWIDPVTEEVQDRPVLALNVDKTAIVANGADCAIITGLPPGTVLRTSNQELVIDDGELVFSTPHPGTHALRFDAFPYQEAEVLIHAA